MKTSARFDISELEMVSAYLVPRQMRIKCKLRGRSEHAVGFSSLRVLACATIMSGALGIAASTTCLAQDNTSTATNTATPYSPTGTPATGTPNPGMPTGTPGTSPTGTPGTSPTGTPGTTTAAPGGALSTTPEPPNYGAIALGILVVGMAMYFSWQKFNSETQRLVSSYEKGESLSGSPNTSGHDNPPSS